MSALRIVPLLFDFFIPAALQGCEQNVLGFRDRALFSVLRGNSAE